MQVCDSKNRKTVLFYAHKSNSGLFLPVCRSICLLPRSTDRFLISSVLVNVGQKKDSTFQYVDVLELNSTEYSKSNRLICKPPAQSIKVQM